MNLTQRQEWIIARYLREAGNALGDVSDPARERALARLNGQVQRVIGELSPDGLPLGDNDVVSALRQLGSPARLAQELVEQGGAPDGFALSASDRKWLGVCGGLAEHFGVESRWVRAGFLALGVTGPLIALIYLALYVNMYLHSEAEGVPRIDNTRFVARFVPVMAAAVALHIGVRLLLWAVIAAHDRVPGIAAIDDIGKWDWLRANMSFFLFCALACVTPLAALSALPLPNDWDETLKRAAQAGLIVYAFVLSLGVAAFLAGVILHTVTALGA